jgi:hypothetical protein
MSGLTKIAGKVTDHTTNFLRSLPSATLPEAKLLKKFEQNFSYLDSTKKMNVIILCLAPV